VRKSTISVCSLSIATGLLFVYFYGMINPARRTFRHALVFLLIFFDFLKSVALLTFCALTLHNEPTKIPSKSMIDGLGWLTLFSIEGADATIMAFAIHMALIIFKTDSISCEQLERINAYLSHINPLTHTDGNLAKHERGLSNFSHIVVFICFLFPTMVASIAFYIHEAYDGFTYYSFMRLWTGPWYFTWTIRHIVAISIIVIYISIYVYIMMQFKKVSKSFKSKKKRQIPIHENDTDFDNDNDLDDDDDDDEDSQYENDGMIRNTFGDTIWYNIFQFLSMLVFPDLRIASKLYGHSLTTEEDRTNIERLKHESSTQTESLFATIPGLPATASASASARGSMAMTASAAAPQTPVFTSKHVTKQIQLILQEEAKERFTARKNQILKQMQMIFIYPISFCLLWLFPFINHYQVIRVKHETMWSNLPAALSQSLTCFVDCMVFMIREKPWTLTEPLEPYTDEYDEVDGQDQLGNQEYYHPTPYARYGWRYYISSLPGYGAYRPPPASIETPNSSFSFDEKYPTVVGAGAGARTDYHGNSVSTYGRGRSSADGYTDADTGNDEDEFSLADFLKMPPKKAHSNSMSTNHTSNISNLASLHTPNVTPVGLVTLGSRRNSKRRSLATVLSRDASCHSHRLSWNTRSSSVKSSGEQEPTRADATNSVMRTERVRASIGSSMSARSSLGSGIHSPPSHVHGHGHGHGHRHGHGHGQRHSHSLAYGSRHSSAEATNASSPATALTGISGGSRSGSPTGGAPKWNLRVFNTKPSTVSTTITPSNEAGDPNDEVGEDMDILEFLRRGPTH
jgi:G protein-coupled receptor GPR1